MQEVKGTYFCDEIECLCSEEEEELSKMNILRITRHPVSEKQLTELVRVFGNGCNVIFISETIPNADRVLELIHTHKADVLEAVLPLPLLADLLQVVKIPVIRAVMNRTVTENGNDATFEFDHYERIVKVIVETERL